MRNQPVHEMSDSHYPYFTPEQLQDIHDFLQGENEESVFRKLLEEETAL